MVIVWVALAVLASGFGGLEVADAGYAMMRHGITLNDALRFFAGLASVAAAVWLFDQTRP